MHRRLKTQREQQRENAKRASSLARSEDQKNLTPLMFGGSHGGGGAAQGGGDTRAGPGRAGEPGAAAGRVGVPVRALTACWSGAPPPPPAASALLPPARGSALLPVVWAGRPGPGSAAAPSPSAGRARLCPAVPRRRLLPLPMAAPGSGARRSGAFRGHNRSRSAPGPGEGAGGAGEGCEAAADRGFGQAAALPDASKTFQPSPLARASQAPHPYMHLPELGQDIVVFGEHAAGAALLNSSTSRRQVLQSFGEQPSPGDAL